MEVMKLTKDNFENEAKNAAMPVLIDFWAAWCGPCRMLSPLVDEIAAEQTAVKVCKVNIDDEPELAAQFGIMSIPTLLLLKNGNVAGKMVGVQSKSAILEMLEQKK